MRCRLVNALGFINEWSDRLLGIPYIMINAAGMVNSNCSSELETKCTEQKRKTEKE